MSQNAAQINSISKGHLVSPCFQDLVFNEDTKYMLLDLHRTITFHFCCHSEIDECHLVSSLWMRDG